MKILIPAFFVASAVIGTAQTGPAVNGTPMSATDPHVTGDRHVQRIEKRLGPTKAERLKYLLLTRELLLEKYDVNRDGVLDDEEKKALLADADKAREASKARLIKRFDKDGDGKLSREEAQEMKKFLKRHHPGKREGDHPPRAGIKVEKSKDGKQHVVRQFGKERYEVRPAVFILMQSLVLQKYDENGNYRIDPPEYAKIQQDADAICLKKTRELLERYDKNSDGKLDDEEKDSLRAANQHDGGGEDPDVENIKFDDIDLFIQKSFEEELMEMLEESSTSE